jgi:polar amino acid transport system substrate-binding protein
LRANRYFLMLFVGLSYFSCLSAQENRASQSVEVYTESLPPYQMVNEDQIVGVATTRVEALLNEAGVPYQLHLVPWARAYNAVNQQSNSLIYSMIRSAEREQLFQWLAVVAKVKNCFVSLADSDLALTSISDIEPYVTGVIRNGYAHSFLLERGFVANKHLFVLATTEEQFHLLLAKK